MTENQSLETTQNTIIEKLKNIFLQKTYQAVIVQGDTLSAFCGALVDLYNHVKVLHVEAGLRTDNIEEPFPEEAYRQMISRIATLHFAPSLQAKENLLKENIDEKNIFVCGNTVIDALKIIIKMYSKECKNKFFLKGINIKSKIVLITAHRRENQNEKLQHILTAIKNLALDFPSYNFIWPVHPNPNVRNIVYEKLSNVKNIILSAPLDYDELIYIMQKANLIMTDSGGIQEEATCLNKSIVIMRNKTERTEILTLPSVKLVGTNEKKIYNEAKNFLLRKFVPKKIFVIYMVKAILQRKLKK